MADNTVAFFLYPPGAGAVGGTGAIPPTGSGMFAEGAPQILYGQGTPDGDRAPFTLVNRGSIYMETNGTDDTTSVWQKVDEGDDNADWVRFLVENQALIDTGDLAVAAGILIEQLEVNARVQTAVWGSLIDISAADSEEIVFHAVAEIEITEIGLLWEEASASDTGINAGDITIGTASAGAEIVAATAYNVAAAAGSYQALSIAEGTVAAGASIFPSHDQAVGAGTYRLIAKYYLTS